MQKRRIVTIVCYLFLEMILMTTTALAAEQHDRAINKWIKQFQPSSFSKKEQAVQLQWFKDVSAPFRGNKIRTAAEQLPVHEYERDVLAKAFEEITGIHVEHENIPEADVVRNLTEQMATGSVIYDAYINDADLIGTHIRLNKIVCLGDYIKGEGAAYTDPGLDLEDILNLEVAKDYDGKQWQIPDQQFANLYWFRYDWFTDEKAKKDFRKRYGYELGVALNWAAYEDIAEFFTGRKMKNPDGSVVTAYGHMDFGKIDDPSLGTRLADSWMSTAGMGDSGLPNGLPVDEWGIRVDNRIPVGSMTERGGATDAPAAVYALTKYITWLNKYAPPVAKEKGAPQSGWIEARGDIAQRIFFYVIWAPGELFQKTPMIDSNGKPVWRLAPTPVGRYWDQGMKVGYRDVGSWTIPRNIRAERRAMAWLWAQFCISKTVSLKKFQKGWTFNRRSTLNHPFIQKNAYKYGGLVEFLKSSDNKKWTDSGLNIPHYPALVAQWFYQLAPAVAGKITPQEALTRLAKAQDDIMGQIKLSRYSPRLNPIKSREYWLNQPGAPKPERPEPPPRTILYEELIKQWK